MTLRRRFWVLLFALSAVSTVQASSRKVDDARDASSRLGVVVRHGDEICAYLAGAPEADTIVRIVVPGRQQSPALASVQGTSSSCRDQVATGMQAFSLRLQRGTVPRLIASVAIVGPSSLRVADDKVIWRLGGESPITFSSCSSADGIHLGAWRRGKRLWHAYTYVGQDLTPDCTPAEEQP